MSLRLVKMSIFLSGALGLSVAHGARVKMPDAPIVKKVKALVPVAPVQASDAERADALNRREAPAVRFKSRFFQLVRPVSDLPKLTKDKPALALILGDRSSSMDGTFKNSDVTKKKAMMMTINQAIADFIERNAYDDTVKPRIEIGAFAYRSKSVKGEGRDVVQNLLNPILNKGVTDKAQRRVIATLPELMENPRGHKELVPGAGEQPIWIGTLADGGTPMRKGFRRLRSVYAGWSADKSAGRLVLGIHVTDGESTDGSPEKQVRKLSKEVATRGDKLLMTNIHLSSKGTTADGVIFPTDEDADRFDEHGQMLFKMSSLVPPEIASRLAAKGIKVKPGARMMAYNSTVEGFASVFAAGSSVAAQ